MNGNFQLNIDTPTKTYSVIGSEPYLRKENLRILNAIKNNIESVSIGDSDQTLTLVVSKIEAVRIGKEGAVND